ncbi:hypothetical protein PT015_23590 [Candidatus Mycobacterium wuenschmannii]|uniref:Uncharacterized protein n=1 Tax=Candidatus Mycobacterium wuenschmannii TaxID=3027808 RepID=A0ABY8VXF8_9MYCO|nr:hypothetical protein [Candidatus Mycobacterium wuenschmannii]WIM87776.1 hypothetical protein PT015_23590 [Candidatus Mycobacterium wuenschmannii]
MNYNKKSTAGIPQYSVRQGWVEGTRQQRVNNSPAVTERERVANGG